MGSRRYFAQCVFARLFHAGRSFGLWALIPLFWAACGSIGDPLPPMADIPEPVNDLAARQVVDEIVVTWSWPLLTTEGASARRLQRFILRAVEAAADSSDLPAVGIDQHGKEIARVDADRMDGKAPGDRFELRFPLEDWKLDRTVILAMAASNRAGRTAGYSNQPRLHPIEPPGAATLADPLVEPHGVAIAWAPLDRAAAYVIERRTGDDPDFSPVARVEQPNFVDRAVQWGRQHAYRVRPFIKTPVGEAEGRLSETVTVTPADTFPPAAPEGLRAVSTESSVELSWDFNRESDLAGYRVLRDGEIISGIVEQTGFSDKQAPRGRQYEYAVIAIDSKGNRSSPSTPVIAGGGGVE